MSYLISFYEFAIFLSELNLPCCLGVFFKTLKYAFVVLDERLCFICFLCLTYNKLGILKVHN